MPDARPGSPWLAGDVGGTKTILALYEGDDLRAPLARRTYDSRSAASLEALVDDFLAGAPAPRSLSLAVAGPVVDGIVRVTNLPWTVSALRLQARYGLERVALSNDVEALGWAVPALRPDEIAVLREGTPDPDGPMALLALGTGLGEGYITGSARSRCVHASEGGHADLGPTSPLQASLLETLWREFPHVSVERVCSGSGLPRVHRFLAERLGESPEVAREIEGAADSTPAIVRAALDGRSSTCREAVSVLCDLLAAEAGNLALKILATGGVYIGGGLAPRLLPFLREERFERAFLAKGRFASLLETVPLTVILAGDAVLWGAAARGMSPV